jgi:hypothetical protein
MHLNIIIEAKFINFLILNAFNLFVEFYRVYFIPNNVKNYFNVLIFIDFVFQFRRLSLIINNLIVYEQCNS